MLIDNKCSRIDNETLDQLSKDKIIIVRCWIKKFLFTNPYNPEVKSSNHLKHILERDTGIHLTNNQFKDAMLVCGYEPVDANELNWQYCISKDAHAINPYYDGHRKVDCIDIEHYRKRFPELA